MITNSIIGAHGPDIRGGRPLWVSGLGEAVRQGVVMALMR